MSLPLSLQRRPPSTRKVLHRGENLQCQKYQPPRVGGLVVGIEQRHDYEYARSLVYGPGYEGVEAERGDVFWSESGFCEAPNVPRFVSLASCNHCASTLTIKSVGVMLSPPDTPHDEDTPVDLSPSYSKIHQDVATGNYIIDDVTGLQLNLRWRLDNSGYDVATSELKGLRLKRPR